MRREIRFLFALYGFIIICRARPGDLSLPLALIVDEIDALTTRAPHMKTQATRGHATARAAVAWKRTSISSHLWRRRRVRRLGLSRARTHAGWRPARLRASQRAAGPSRLARHDAATDPRRPASATSAPPHRLGAPGSRLRAGCWSASSTAAAPACRGGARGPRRCGCASRSAR